MSLPPTRPFGALGALLVAALMVVPTTNPLPHRDAERDIAGLRQAECEYQGIKASFDELTRVYALQAYEGGRLVRWESCPDPGNPETEALVTAVFAVTAAKTVAYAMTPELFDQRRSAVPELAVTWRYSAMSSLRVEPANAHAADAIAEYRRTVDGFVERMVVTLGPTPLRRGPGPGHPVVDQVPAGTVLLREDGSSPETAWVHVRIPSSQTEGWVEQMNLRVVNDAR